MSGPSPAVNAAIQYRIEGFDTSKQKLMGRHAAGEGFLKGFLRHSGADTLYCYAATKEVAGHYQRLVRDFGSAAPVVWLNEGDAASPARVGTLHLSDPSLATAAWRRRAHDQRLYSITGLTHTTASAGAMDWIISLLSAPVQSWDALVCTSQVVHDTVTRILAAQQDYLAARFGAGHFTKPSLPVIPLGVDTDLYRPDAERRAAARAALGLGENDIAFLFVGRLSFHAKAHPLPMYLALERVAQALGRKNGGKLHLIQAGWFANDFIDKAFRGGAATFCPSVQCSFLDGRKAELRERAWRAADVFTSLSDNFQETFGLTPIEAMAAGLPGVVTDWNGYRDTVRDGTNGFRIPTLIPRTGLGTDMADRHAAELDTYDTYCGYSSQFVAVDPNAVARAYMTLIEDSDLRHRMGAAARAHAIQAFDWSVIIARYQALWQDLAEQRLAAPESAARAEGAPSNPARTDPFYAFESYASDILTADHIVAATPGADGARLQMLVSSPLISFIKPMAPDLDDCARLLADLQRRGTQRVGDILDSVPENRRDRLERGLVWLTKLSLLTVRKPGGQ